MQKWHIKVKSNPQEIIERLGSIGRFVFNLGRDNKNSLVFNLRKRVRCPDQILHRNRIVVNGTILKSDTVNEADVEITFTQHLFMKLTILSIVVFGLGLIAIITKLNSFTAMFILGGILLAVAFVLWNALQNKFEIDILKYKTLISGLLEV